MGSRSRGGVRPGWLIVLVVLAALGAVAWQHVFLLVSGRDMRDAAQVGIVEAVQPGSTRQSVEEEIRHVLERKAWRDHTHIQVLVNGVLDVGQTAGTELAAAKSKDDIQVQIRVSAALVAPDLWAPVGYSLRSLELVGKAGGKRP